MPAASIYLRSVKISFYNPEILEETRKRHRGFICAFWHNRMLPLIWTFRHQNIAAMVSPSRDGEIVARALKRLGYEVVRGSSYKRSVAGTKEAVKKLREGKILALIPDGPRGPIYTVNPGAIALSQITQKPILPTTCVFTSYWQTRSWDKFMIPKPFSKIVIGFYPPFTVPKEHDPEPYRKHLKQALFDIEDKIINYLKR